MAKKKQTSDNTVVIDLDVWTTVTDKARSEGITHNAISNRIKRGKIETLYIKPLYLLLVKK